jgi:hypothetical protein
MECKHCGWFGSVAGIAVGILGFGWLYGQMPVTLQPFTSLPPHASLGPAPIPRHMPPQAEGPSQVTLQGIPRLASSPLQDPLTASEDKAKEKSPLQLDPLKPAVNNPANKSTTSKAGKLNVDQMIRTPIDHVQAMSKVNAKPPATELQPLPSVRGQHFDGNVFAEWNSMGYCWSSPAFCHRPLYFEQPNLERYGIGHGHYVDPWLSAAHFYGNVMVLPFKAVWDPCWGKSCSLGNNRPGDCVPVQRQGIQAKVNRMAESRHIGEG